MMIIRVNLKRNMNKKQTKEKYSLCIRRLNIKCSELKKKKTARIKRKFFCNKDTYNYKSNINQRRDISPLLDLFDYILFTNTFHHLFS